MTWIQEHWMALLLALAALVLGWSLLTTSCLSAKVREAEQAAAAHAAASETLKDLAQKEARNGQLQETRAQESEARLALELKRKAQLSAEVARLEGLVTPVPSVPDDAGPVSADERDGWRRAVQSRDDVIVALKAERSQDAVADAERDRLAASLLLAVENYKASYQTMAASREEEVKANAQLRLALEAQKGLTRAAYVKGFFLGLGVGAGGGVVAGSRM